MNILIAANYATPQSGNFIASVLELGLTLRSQGDDLFFIFPKCDNTLRENSWISWLQEHNFTVYLIDKEVSEAVLLNELNTIIQTHSIDVLHTHFSMYEHLITHHRNSLPVKIVVHHHSGFAYGKSMLKQKVSNYAKALRYRFLNIGLLCVNQDIALSYKPAKARYIPNGVSLNRHVLHSRTGEECRQELGIPAEEKVCLFLGWAFHTKGLDVAVSAVSLLRQADPSISLAVVGVGVPPRQTALDYIRSKTCVDPGASWIRFLPDTEDMYAYHRMADVYLSASRSEGFPYGVLEAITQNTPIVSSDIPQTRWTEVYEHVFFYPVDDPSACAKAIGKALDAGRSETNGSRILEDYSIAKWCQDVIAAYRAL